MGRRISYLLLLLPVLLFFSFGMTDGSVAPLYQKHVVNNAHPDNTSQRSLAVAGNKPGKEFAFCRSEKESHSSSTTERVLLSGVLVVFAFSTAVACRNAVSIVRSCATHLTDFLWSLLYPKHSFW